MFLSVYHLLYSILQVIRPRKWGTNRGRQYSISYYTFYSVVANSSWSFYKYYECWVADLSTSFPSGSQYLFHFPLSVSLWGKKKVFM